MKIIDPSGIFNGDRFDDVSDEARLYWPFFWCVSNGCGRLELNYLKVVGQAFSRFKEPISEQTFWNLINEYQEAFLLHVYEAAGQLWGQWATSEKYLPTYKRSEDLESPKPNSFDLIAWQDAYLARKTAKSNAISNCKNVSEKLLKRSREISEAFSPGEERRGEECIGERKTLSCNDGTNEAGAQPAPESVRSSNSAKRASEETAVWFDEKFWPAYPRRQGKHEAQRAAAKHGKTAADREAILAGLELQLPELRQREQQFVPLAATWLNKKRWQDSPEASIAPLAGGGNGPSSIHPIPTAAERRRAETIGLLDGLNKIRSAK